MMHSQEYWDMKRDISILIITRIAEELGMTYEEYGSVYDSEAHEVMLNNILIRVKEYGDKYGL